MMFRSILTNKFLMAAIVIVISFFAFARFQLAHPTHWDEIKVGMSRSEVYALVGNPSQSSGDIKGDFWWVDKLTQQHELHAFFEDERVTSVYILRKIGTRDHFRNFYVKDDSITPIPKVTYCQLRANWQHFNGKTVRVETDLYWFQHGYYFVDEACTSSDSQHPSLIDEERTAVTYEASQRDLLWSQLERFPLDPLNSPVARIVAIGKFSRESPGVDRSDALVDRTSYRFEISSIEKAVRSE